MDLEQDTKILCTNWKGEYVRRHGNMAVSIPFEQEQIHVKDGVITSASTTGLTGLSSM